VTVGVAHDLRAIVEGLDGDIYNLHGSVLSMVPLVLLW
jgi:hypothetical protein